MKLQYRNRHLSRRATDSPFFLAIKNKSNLIRSGLIRPRRFSRGKSIYRPSMKRKDDERRCFAGASRQIKRLLYVLILRDMMHFFIRPSV